ncbi:MAG: hypothetical protein NT027_12925 [Proteobacteria bacterium]|nr:hypothetical protein [Pseudomonadota bacterium]
MVFEKAKFCLSLSLVCALSPFVNGCRTAQSPLTSTKVLDEPTPQTPAPPGPVTNDIHPSFKTYLEIVGKVGTKTSLSTSEISRLYQSTIQHPIAKVSAVDKYDPDGIIGFCFGRSMTANLIGRNIGLKKESMAKLFVMGDLRSEGHSAPTPEWYFHVTQLALGPNKTWYAIDPIMHTEGTAFKPLTAAQWMKAVTRGWDATHGRTAKAKSYFIDSDAILPDIRNVPDFDKETGVQLIETIFDPAKNGISLAKDWSRKVKIDSTLSNRSYLITKELMEKHFLHATVGTQTTFDFDKVVVGTTPISYNNYFVDLLNSSLEPIATPAPASPRSLALSGSSDPTTSIPPSSQWKGGFKFKSK